MLAKLITLLSIIYLGNFYHAQSTFPFNREWGTYVGGSGTVLFDYGHDGNSFFTDSQNNIFVNGRTNFQSGYLSSYYNQFVTGGGNNADFSNVIGYYHSKFSSTGQMLLGSFTSSGSATISYYRYLIGLDQADNKYYVTRQSGQISNLSTSGAWLTQNTNTTENFTYTLSKYNSSGTLMWTTYLPNNYETVFFLRFDENQNIYVHGTTDENIPGFGTQGVFQENYINFSTIPANPSLNSYIAKLSSSGQKIWATYSVLSFSDVDYYNNGLYLIFADQNNFGQNYVTAGTFQPNIPSRQLIAKFDASNGQLVWGTYYGTTSTGFLGIGVYDLEVNETGLYLSGQSSDTSNPTYFSTPGAFKTQLTGGGDLFLSKFNHNGSRIWSTYFGGNDYDDIIGSPNMTVLGSRIVIAGNQYGGTNNISTPDAFLTTIPNASSGTGSMFFGEFDSNGNRKWTSYYGGPSNSSWGEHINPEFLSDGSLILWGATGSSTGIGTEGAAYQFMINPYPSSPFGYIAKFTPRNELSTSDLIKNNDLQLYDNPNNGNFTISGSILEKQKASLSVFDMSGKLIHQTSFEKKKTNHFNLQNQLTTGNYLLEVTSEKGEKLKVFKMTVK